MNKSCEYVIAIIDNWLIYLENSLKNSQHMLVLIINYVQPFLQIDVINDYEQITIVHDTWINIHNF